MNRDRGLGDLRHYRRLFTSLVQWILVVSLVTVGIVAESVAQELTNGERKARRMQRAVDVLTGHYIVYGFGRMGSLVARDLTAEGKEVVVLDADADSRERAAAAGFVTAIDDDADNVYATISARSLNPDIFIVSRASTRNVMHKLELAGADRAISSYVMAGRRAVQLATRPGVVDFIDALGR